MTAIKPEPRPKNTANDRLANDNPGSPCVVLAGGPLGGKDQDNGAMFHYKTETTNVIGMMMAAGRDRRSRNKRTWKC